MNTHHDSGALRALDELGWDPAWARSADALHLAGTRPARVVAQHRDAYLATDGTADLHARLAGRLRHEAGDDGEKLPAVGDWVLVRASADGGTGAEGQVVAVLPRRGAFVRKEAGARSQGQVVAANVDHALVLCALPDDVNLRRIERYLALAWEGGASPQVVLSKADLATDADAEVARVRAAIAGVEVLALSARTGEGVDALAARLARASTAVLLGASGAGKSTLVNRLLGHERQRTGGVRDDGKGRHTTTHREMLRLPNGALLVDTPGMRELQLWSAESGLESAFADVEALAAGCRFGDCRHEREPGCAVRAAVERGTLDAARLEHWRQLGRELAHLARRQDERLASEHRRALRPLMRSVRDAQKRKW